MVIVAGFLLLGLAAGFFFSGRASAEGSGQRPGMGAGGLCGGPHGYTYYVDCYDYIKEQRKVLCSYIDGVRNDSSITESQQEQLLEMKEEILIFDEDELVPIYWDLNAPMRLPALMTYVRALWLSIGGSGRRCCKISANPSMPDLCWIPWAA